MIHNVPTSRGRKALLFANTDWYLWNFRLPLARALRDAGWEVVLVSPPGRFGSRLEGEGFRWQPFAFSRGGTNPFAELATMARLARLYRRERPHLAHHFTIKCVLYGGLAARSAGTPSVVSAITGMGTLFTTRNIKTAILRPLAKLLYRLVLRRTHVIFQNPDDHREFQALGVLDGVTTHVIRGSGIDVARFAFPRPPLPDDPVVFVLVARLLREKGIAEFCEAAGILRRSGMNARFLVVGDPDPGNPSSIDARTLAAWKRDGPAEFLGHSDDVPAILGAAHVACLPSWREGTPRSLLEAMAAGLPLVATDVPGCREVVSEGDNGFLVPPRDPPALAAALGRLAVDPALRERMGRRSRAIVCERFSIEEVLRRTFEVYEAAA